MDTEKGCFRHRLRLPDFLWSGPLFVVGKNLGVKINILSMQRVAESESGYDLLTEAMEDGAKTVLQRNPPHESGDDERGTFILMFLDWQQGLILHVELGFDAYEKFLEKGKELFEMSMMDSFDLEGAKIQ